MPEPITIIAGVLSIVNGTITATKTLLDFIDSIRNAPKLVIELRRDVESTNSIIQAIEDLLRPMEDSVEGIPADLRACFSSTDHTLEDCKVVTEEFGTKLKKWFKDSAWDRLKPTFKDAEIERFRTRLRDTRDVLNLNLKVCTMKFHGIQANKARAFEEELRDSCNNFPANSVGLKSADKKFSVSQQQNMIALRLYNHELLIREAIKLCAAGLDETSKKTGNNVKLVKTLDTARVLIAQISGGKGDIAGGIDIDEIIAAGNSRIVGFTNDANFALQFLK